MHLAVFLNMPHCSGGLTHICTVIVGVLVLILSSKLHRSGCVFTIIVIPHLLTTESLRQVTLLGISHHLVILFVINT